FKQAATMRPPDAELHTLIGRALINDGSFDEAHEQLDLALAIDPDHLVAIASKADLFERRNQLEEALALIQPVIEQNRDNAPIGVAHAQIALSQKNDQEAIAITRRHLLTNPLDTFRRPLLFLLGKALERTGEYDEAFEAYRSGNEVLREPFDAADHVARIDGIIASFSAERMALLPKMEPTDDTPVFIIGMFRSGSTLTETIIDTHPDAAGAGESQLIRRLWDSLLISVDSRNHHQRNIHELKARDLDRLRTEYLDGIRKLARPAKCVLDKSLGNYLQLGFLTALFGKPRIIHCRRNPIDTCFSCYAEHLSTMHGYCSDLEGLGVVHRQYERLMDHWRQTLDIPMLEIDYEELVADQEHQTRRIIEFCGLSWDEECLRFNESSRVAHTASYAQIRQPIYKTAVSRGAKFEKHLGPLRAALEG
ncbi:MAG: sulfotransferase, partial [Deltaproteobacteria bacterium]|nr:sulfotransferase [Deltaproteobacteria bacterium]